MYYVSVMESNRKRYVLAAGPFNRHGDAERCVGHVRRLVDDEFPREAPWVSYGTCHVKHGPAKPGKFNGALGLPVDGSRIGSLPIEDHRWPRVDDVSTVVQKRRWRHLTKFVPGTPLPV